MRPGRRRLDVAALLGREVHDHRARRHRLDHLVRDQHRRLGPLHLRRGDDHVAGGHGLEHQLALLGDRLVAHRRRVGARARALLAGLEVELHEPRPQAADLLLGRLAHVVGLDHRAQAAGGGDRRQAGDPRPDHEHAWPAGSCPRPWSSGGRPWAAPGRRSARRGTRRCWPASSGRPSTARAWCAAGAPARRARRRVPATAAATWGAASGAAMPTTAWPARRRAASGLPASPPSTRTHATTSARQGVLARADRRALLLVCGVGEARRHAGPRLHHDRGPQLDVARHHRRGHRHPPLALARLRGGADGQRSLLPRRARGQRSSRTIRAVPGRGSGGGVVYLTGGVRSTHRPARGGPAAARRRIHVSLIQTPVEGEVR